MAKPQGPRPIIVEIAKPYGLEVIQKHWALGSTVTRDYFLDLFPLVVEAEHGVRPHPPRSAPNNGQER